MIQDESVAQLSFETLQHLVKHQLLIANLQMLQNEISLKPGFHYELT